MTLFKRLRRLFDKPPSRNQNNSDTDIDTHGGKSASLNNLVSAEQLAELEEKFYYRFNNREMLMAALCHRSIQNTNGSGELQSNERLEFLGDSILGMAISEFLFRKYPQYREGKLTKLKGSLVSEAVLYKVAKKIDLGKYLIMSDDEHRSGGRDRKTILADGYEAVLGAIFLDGGLEPAKNAVNHHILENHKSLIAGDEHVNYKGRLLEHMQGRGMGVPRYEVLKEVGPEHRKIFKVAAKIRNKHMGVGHGRTKKEAEQWAAKVALEKLTANDKNQKAGE
ncbi:MAG: ribonuclease III [candidate division Zixibacteria bacterium]|nr:ribonuclease III [candidate division Zixibacteria bacterium]